jgi:dienelactone hydrolase
VLIAAALLAAVVAVRAGSGLNLLETGFVAATLVTALWWVVARRQMHSALNRWSLTVGALAAVEVGAQGPTWQQSGWQVLAGLTAASALWRMWHPSPSGRTDGPRRSVRWARGAHRAVLVGAVLICGALTQFALVPTLPTPTGTFHVGSQVFGWTDLSRPETLTSVPGDLREVVAQAWYPTDVTTGRSTKYIDAQRDDRLTPGLPPGFFRRYGGHINTHALDGVPVSGERDQWPVLLFSPGLGVARQSYTALCTELASRGYVVVAMSHPYESPVTVLADGRRATPRTFLPTSPAGLAEVARLVDLRAADSRFVLSQLERLSVTNPRAPLAGHLDLAHVGIFGHSLGGATAVKVLATDDRFRAGVDLDGRLFGTVPALRQPFLWVQSGGSTADTSEHIPMHRTRDEIMNQLEGGGALVTIANSLHMSLSDSPAYLTPFGRHLIGNFPPVAIGSTPVADMTSITADLVASVMGPTLNGPDRGNLSRVAARNSAVQINRIVTTDGDGGWS